MKEIKYNTISLRLGVFLCLLFFAVIGNAQTSIQEVETKVGSVIIYPQFAKVSRTVKIELPAGESTIILSGISPKVYHGSIEIKTESGRSIENFDYQIVSMDEKRQIFDNVKTTNIHSLNIKEIENSMGQILIKISREKAIREKITITYYVSDVRWEPVYDCMIKGIYSPIELILKANIFQNSGEDWKDVKLTLSVKNPRIPRKLIPQTSKNIWLSPGNRKENWKPHTDMILTGQVMDRTGQPLIDASISVLDKESKLLTGTWAEGGFYIIKLPESADKIQVSSIFLKPVQTEITSDTMDIVLDEAFDLGDVIIGHSRLLTKSDEYYLTKKHTIYNGKQPNTIEIESRVINAEYKYCITSGIQDFPNLQVKIDGSKIYYNFVDGKMTIYYANRNQGILFLETGKIKGPFNEGLMAYPNDLEINLGADPEVIVVKDQVIDTLKANSPSGDIIIQYTKEITIQNNKNVPINISVSDQFPVSIMREVVVEELSYDGGILNENTKSVHWKNQMAPQESKKYTLKYNVKYPKGRELKFE